MTTIRAVGLALVAMTITISLNTTIARATDTLFYDGFESGDFSNWSSVNGTWKTVKYAANAHSGSYRGEVKGGGTDMSLTKGRPTDGYQNVGLEYWYKISEKLESGDHVAVEWSSDGAIWTQLADYSDMATTSWTYEGFSLPETALNENFQLRFRATLGSAGDVFWLDDVGLFGDGGIFTPTPTPTAEPTPTASPTPSPSSTPTATPSATPTVKPTSTPKPSATPTPTPRSTPAFTPHPTPGPVESVVSTQVATTGTKQILKTAAVSPRSNQTSVSDSSLSSSPAPTAVSDSFVAAIAAQQKTSGTKLWLWIPIGIIGLFGVYKTLGNPKQQ